MSQQSKPRARPMPSGQTIRRDLGSAIDRADDDNSPLTAVRAIRGAMRAALRGRGTASDALATINAVLGAHGVEAIRAPGRCDPHWGDVVALYCNAGETYASTVLFDVGRVAFYVTSYGDWVETAERTGRYKFD